MWRHTRLGGVSEMWPPVTRRRRNKKFIKFVWRNLWMAPFFSIIWLKLINFEFWIQNSILEKMWNDINRHWIKNTISSICVINWGGGIRKRFRSLQSCTEHRKTEERLTGLGKGNFSLEWKSAAVVIFLDRNFHHESVASKIPQDSGWKLIPDSHWKCLPLLQESKHWRIPWFKASCLKERAKGHS